MAVRNLSRGLSRILTAAVLLIILGLLAGCLPYEFKGAVLDPPKPLEDFTLPTADGGTFRLSDYRGRLLLVYFGYTYCPDVCPATLYQVRQAVALLGDQAADVQVVMVTVDPGRDTPDLLSRYVGNFNDTFIGLHTTDRGQLDAVLAQFGAFYIIEEPEQPGADDYLVTHTASVFLVDRDSRLREIFMYGTTGEEMAGDIRQILKER